MPMSFNNPAGWRLLPMVLFAALLGCSSQDQAPPALVETMAPPPEANAQFTASLQAIRAGRWAQAERQLLALAEGYPDYSNIFLNLGIIYLETDRADAAISAFERAIAADPRSAAAYNHLGAALRKAGMFRQAEANYLRALQRIPDHPETHLNLGILCDLYLGKLDEARQHYEFYQSQQIEADPEVSIWIADIDRRLAGRQLQEQKR